MSNCVFVHCSQVLCRTLYTRTQRLRKCFLLRLQSSLCVLPNHDIAHQRNGQELTPEELGDWYVKLEDVGRVHNINLITPEHIVPQVVLSILHARDHGLKVPIIYNTSASDSLASIEMLVSLWTSTSPISKSGIPVRRSNC